MPGVLHAAPLFAMCAEQLPRRDLDTDASTGLPGICGECKVLVNSAFHSVLVAPLVANRRLTRVLSDADFSGTYTSSCAAYCHAMCMSCVGRERVSLSSAAVRTSHVIDASGLRTEVGDTCEVQREEACDSDPANWGGTSDAICECAPSPKGGGH